MASRVRGGLQVDLERHRGRVVDRGEAVDVDRVGSRRGGHTEVVDLVLDDRNGQPFVVGCGRAGTNGIPVDVEGLDVEVPIARESRIAVAQGADLFEGDLEVQGAGFGWNELVPVLVARDSERHETARVDGRIEVQVRTTAQVSRVRQRVVAFGGVVLEDDQATGAIGAGSCGQVVQRRDCQGFDSLVGDRSQVSDVHRSGRLVGVDAVDDHVAVLGINHAQAIVGVGCAAVHINTQAVADRVALGHPDDIGARSRLDADRLEGSADQGVDFRREGSAKDAVDRVLQRCAVGLHDIDHVVARGAPEYDCVFILASVDRDIARADDKRVLARISCQAGAGEGVLQQVVPVTTGEVVTARECVVAGGSTELYRDDSGKIGRGGQAVISFAGNDLQCFTTGHTVVGVNLDRCRETVNVDLGCQCVERGRERVCFSVGANHVDRVISAAQFDLYKPDLGGDQVVEDDVVVSVGQVEVQVLDSGNVENATSGFDLNSQEIVTGCLDALHIHDVVAEVECCAEQVCATPALQHVITVKETPVDDVGSIAGRHQVDARVAVDRVVPRTGGQGVVTFVSVNHVVPRPTVDDVVAFIAVDDVGTRAGQDAVVSGSTSNGVIAGPGEDRVVAITTEDLVATVTGDDVIVVVVSTDGVDPIADSDSVVAFVSVDHVVSVGRGDCVVAFTSGDRVVAGAADDDVIAALTIQAVVSVAAVDQVGDRRADQRVVTGATNECSVGGGGGVDDVVPIARVDVLGNLGGDSQRDTVVAPGRVDLESLHSGEYGLAAVERDG